MISFLFNLIVLVVGGMILFWIGVMALALVGLVLGLFFGPAVRAVAKIKENP